MEVHLVDGTYELFRYYFAVPPSKDARGREVGAVKGVISSLKGLAHGGATHIGVATDHVVESFRNQLWSGYKTGEGIEPDLLAQFPLLGEALPKVFSYNYFLALLLIFSACWLNAILKFLNHAKTLTVISVNCPDLRSIFLQFCICSNRTYS